MAILLPTLSDYLSRDGSFHDLTQDWTITRWAQVSRVGGTYITTWLLGASDYSTPWIWLGRLSDGTWYVEADPGSGEVFAGGYAATTNQWIFLAARYHAITQQLDLVINGVLFATTPGDFTGAVSPTNELLGTDNNGGQPAMGVGYARDWQAALTDAEILLEMASPVAVRQANLLADTPLLNAANLKDLVAGHDWTATGTPSDTGGPAVATPARVGALAFVTGFEDIARLVSRETGTPVGVLPLTLPGQGNADTMGTLTPGQILLCIKGSVQQTLILSSSFIQQAATNFLGVGWGIYPRSGTTTFYSQTVALVSDRWQSTIVALDQAGAALHSWVLPTTIGDHAEYILENFGVAHDGSIAYHSGQDRHGQWAAGILRYNLLTGATLADLVDDTLSFANTIAVLPSGEILAQWVRNDRISANIRRYAPDGTLLTTYAIPCAPINAPGTFAYGVFFAWDPLDPSIFWTCGFAADSTIQLTRAKIDGSATTSFDVTALLGFPGRPVPFVVVTLPPGTGCVIDLPAGDDTPPAGCVLAFPPGTPTGM